MSDIAAWLENLGLGKYQGVFDENEIVFEILSELTAEHLKEMGLPLGPRLQLLKAIAALRERKSGSAFLQESSDTAALTPRQAERRQLTVMFVDLVGSTALSERLDPEDLRELILAYQNTVAGEISRYEGHIAKYMGDGVLAYFGWPRAHEDDAERAVRAAMVVSTSVAKLSHSDGMCLAVRIGIATGLVVVGDLIGDGAAREQAVVGETPNLAARLQGLAQSGAVVIGESTRRLLGRLFELVDLGPQALKGFSGAVGAWQVIGESQAGSRFEALHAAHLTPIVGRERELGLLLERWTWATEGDGQVVLISGEPGIGKSRLIHTLREKLAGHAHVLITQYCSPYHTRSAFHPVIGWLERMAQFAQTDGPERRLSKLEAALKHVSNQPGKQMPLLAALLGIPADARYPILELAAEEQKRHTLRALVGFLAELAAQHPVLALFEDAHWIDPSTLELLGLVIERCPQLPVLVLITCRKEFQPPWREQAHMTSVTLSRLGRRQGSDMVAQVAGGKALPGKIHEQIVDKTDGVPLFVEELTKTVLESGLLTDAGDHYELTGPLPALDIPTTLSDSLMARLDRLAPAIKEVAQIGAAIGREFSYVLLAAVIRHDEQKLSAALDQLVKAGLIFQRGLPPEAVYTFKHALVRDTAYSSLLLSRRRQLHSDIASALQAQLPALVKAQPELLAQHYTEAGLALQAARFWQLAGEHAAERAAHVEAISHFSKGLDQLDAIKDEPERSSAIIQFNLGLAASMRIIERLDEALEALERAEQAATASANNIALAEVCYLRGNLYFPMGQIEDCLVQHQRSRDYSRAGGAPKLEARALGGLGDAYYLRGRMITAMQHFRRCVALSEENGDEDTATAYRGMYGIARFYSNECAEALGLIVAAAEEAAQKGNLRAELIAQSAIGYFCFDMLKLDQARAALEAGMALSQRLGARRFEALLLAYLAEFTAIEGRQDEAGAVLEKAYAICLETSLTFLGPVVLGRLARLTDDEKRSQWALQEGENLLRRGCAGHCHLYFYRDALEAALAAGDWGKADYYAAALEAYAAPEPLPWTDFFIARGRVLAAHGRRTHAKDALREQLQPLRDEAIKIGLLVAVPALDRALE